MSDSNRVRMSYILESTWGVQPPAANLQDVRRTGGGFTRPTTSEMSNEVVSDRQVTDVIRTAVEAQGTVEFEFSAQSFEDFIEGLLMNGWSNSILISGTDIAAVDSGNKLTSSTTDFSVDIVADQIVRVGGFVAGNNNGDARVVSVSANELVLDVLDLDLSDESAGPTVTVDGKRNRNGTTLKSFTLEEEFQDIASTFFIATGCRIGSMEMSIAPGSIITGSFGFVGKDVVPASASAGSGYDPANTNAVMNAVDHVSSIFEGGAINTLDVTELSFSAQNGLRSLQAVANLSAVGVQPSRFEVTGTFNAYFANKTIIEKFTNWTTSSLRFRLQDSSGKAVWFSFPAIKFTGELPDPGQIDTDVIAAMPWTAFKEATNGYTMQVCVLP